MNLFRVRLKEEEVIEVSSDDMLEIEMSHRLIEGGEGVDNLFLVLPKGFRSDCHGITNKKH